MTICHGKVIVMTSKNRQSLQNIFNSKTEYQKYLRNAYNFLRGRKKRDRHSIMPTYLEIRLNINLKNQRLFIDKDDYDTLVVELPIKKNIPLKKRELIKSKAFITYGPLLACYEKALADEFAIAEKLIDMK